MRRLAVASALACLSWTASWTAHAATIEPPDSDFRLKVLEERDDGQWHGHHQHWLYDQENQPETNATASNPQDCTEYRVRVPKAGAGTEIKRTQKCD